MGRIIRLFVLLPMALLLGATELILTYASLQPVVYEIVARPENSWFLSLLPLFLTLLFLGVVLIRWSFLLARFALKSPKLRSRNSN